MAKILLTWEGGAYLGHQTLVTVAAAVLHEAGHDLVVVTPHGTPPNEATQRPGLRWTQLPPRPAEGRLPAAGLPWHSRATTLWEFGFQSEEVLRDRFEAWDVVLHREQPDVAFLQAAPFAQVAAHVAGVRSVEFGVGFDVPPLQQPFPAFRHCEAFDPVRALHLERQIIDRLARVIGHQAHERPLHGWVSAPVRLVTSIRELDPYDGCADPSREFVGPLPMAEIGGTRPEWQRGGPRVLAYLRAGLMDMPAFIEALGALEGDAVLVCPDAGPDLVAQARTAKVRMFVKPVSLGALLPKADLVVSHGGGLIAEALVRGRPCVAMPTHFEQFLTAMTLKRHGLGVVVNPAEGGTYERGLRYALHDPALKVRAGATGRQYARSQDSTVQRLLDAA